MGSNLQNSCGLCTVQLHHCLFYNVTHICRRTRPTTCLPGRHQPPHQLRPANAVAGSHSHRELNAGGKNAKNKSAQILCVSGSYAFAMFRRGRMKTAGDSTPDQTQRQNTELLAEMYKCLFCYLLPVHLNGRPSCCCLLVLACSTCT